MRCAVILSMVVAVASSCGMVERRLAIRNCRFTLQSVKPTGIDLLGARFEVRIGVENPNDIEAIVDGCDFDFYLNGARLISGTNHAKVAVPPGETRTLPLDLSVPYAAAIRFVEDVRSNDFKDYRVAGQVYVTTVVGMFTYPVDLKGQFR